MSNLRFILLACLPCCVALAGCSQEEKKQFVETFVEHFRQDNDRAGKVGILRALEVRHRAHALARREAKRPDASCGLEETAPSYYRAELELVRRSAKKTIRWKETRQLHRDALGNVEVLMEAVYEVGDRQEAARRRRWVRVDDTVYVGDEDLFYVYDPKRDEPLSVEGKYAEVLQSLLDLAPGWRSTGPGQWSIGTKPLRCGISAEIGSAFGDLLDGLPVPEASFSVENGERRLQALWTLDGGVRLEATYRDRSEVFEGTIERPAEEKIIDLEVDRSLLESQTLLKKMAADKWVTLPAEEKRE